MPQKIKSIFERFVERAHNFIYIQDPYFDYNYYKDLIEDKDLPANIEIKVLHKAVPRNLPNNHNIDMIPDPKIDGEIHDRFIITEDFGYQIGISLNGIHKNKAFIKEILNLEDIKKLFP